MSKVINDNRAIKSKETIELGSLLIDVVLNTTYYYVLAMVRSKYVAVNIETGNYYSDPNSNIAHAIADLKKLPEGSQITLQQQE